VSVLSEGAVLSGRLVANDIDVLGRFEGTLDVRGKLHIDQKAQVKAQVQAGRVEVEGEFEGEIEAGAIAFGERARARGAFRAEQISMREGAVVDGDVNLPQSPPARVDSVADDAPERWEEGSRESL